MDEFSIQRIVVKLPCLLHISSILFIIGVLAFLFELNLIIFGHIHFFSAVSLAAYAFLTFLPLFQHESLLYTPLSKFPGSLISIAIAVLLIIRGEQFIYKGWGFQGFGWAFEDVGKNADAIASNQSPDIDFYLLDWTLNSLGEDNAVKEFFQAIPDLLSHSHASHARIQGKFKQVLDGFLNRTFHSNMVVERVRYSRLIVCLGASHAVFGPKETSRMLDDILNGRWPNLLQSIEMGHSLIS